MKWNSKFFIKYDTESDFIMYKVEKFLNENKIEDFKIVQMRDGWLEIVYKK